MAILGGAKVSDKIKTIDNLIDKCDTLLIGGGMAYTFMLADGYEVGNSLKEPDQVENAKAMKAKAEAKGCKLLTPVDTICAKEFDNDSPRSCHELGDIPADEMGMDIGPKTIELFCDEIAKAKTIFWNGPMGVFEMPNFQAGTKAVGEAIAANKDCFSCAGGGDSVAAVNQFGLADDFSFISTGGGAAIQIVQGEKLPAVEALLNSHL